MTFELQQGIENPRYGTLDWMVFDVFGDRAAALREARKHRGAWRIVQTTVVWLSEDEVERKAK